MSPAEIIEQATKDGVLLALSPSGSMSLKGVQSAVDRWLPAIRQSKAAIVLLLRPDTDGWSAEDWQVFFDERAAIAEFDGGLMRIRAEAGAFACCVAEWLNRNPMYSQAGSCFGCGGSEHAYDLLRAFRTGSAGCVWLHSRRHPAWYTVREAEAVAALAAIGINIAN
jgi:hypothetical protein